MSRTNRLFLLLDDWLPDPGPALTRDGALATLAQRYFTSHGPATQADFAWWAGLTMADAKRAMEAAAIDVKAWPAGAAAPPGGVYLLPGFDEYLLGYKDRNDVLDPRFAERIVPGGNGVFKPMIVVGGRIAGTWQRSAAGLSPEPFMPLKRADTKALAAAVQRYQAFCGEAP